MATLDILELKARLDILGLRVNMVSMVRLVVQVPRVKKVIPV